MDDLGFIKAVDRLGERIVVRVADAADRGFDAGLGETIGVFNRNVLHAAVAVVDESGPMCQIALNVGPFFALKFSPLW